MQQRVLAQEDSEPIVHVVGAGETLSEIAKSYAVSMATLMQLNGITDADTIYVGQPLRIPKWAKETDVSATAEESKAESAPTDVESPPIGASEEASGRSPAAETSEEDETTTSELPLAGLQPVSTTSQNATYTVQTSDTLGRIALRYDLDVAALRTVNNLASDAPCARASS